MHKTFSKQLAIAASLLALPLSSNATIWIHDAGDLGKIDPITGVVTDVGPFGVSGTMTDIAFDSSGNLFGIGFNQLFSINSGTGAATAVGPGWAFSLNALEIVGTKAFAMASADDHLYSIDLGTGVASSLGSTGTGNSSSGDLAWFSGNMYGTVNTGSFDSLLDVDEVTPGNSSIVGSNFGVDFVFGLAEDGGLLYALETGGGIHTVNTGAGTLNNIGSAAFTANLNGIFGATSTQNYGATPTQNAVPDGGSTLPMLALPFLGVFLLRRKLRS